MASTSSAGIKIIKDDEIDAKHFEKDLMRCSIPKIPSEQIYKREGFKLMPDYSIETYEQTTSLTIEQDTVPLFDEEFFTKHKRKYKFLHVGSVQVMASPLTRLGINNSIIVCLRDGRRSTPRDSLLGLVETSLCQGPIYFHCFPNRTIPLTGISVHRTIFLYVLKYNYNMVPGCHPIDLSYRVRCKLMAVDSDSGALVQSLKGETKCFHIIRQSNEIVTRTTKWDQFEINQKNTSHQFEINQKNTSPTQEV